MKKVMKHPSFMQYAVSIILLIGCMFIFLVGINGLSDATKLFSSEYVRDLFDKVSNPVIGLFVGIIASALMQSSSATTAITIGMVSSQALSLENAVPILMGANIGTTITNTLIALTHINQTHEFKRAIAASTLHDFFNIITTAIAFPLEYYFHFISKSASYLYHITSNNIDITVNYKSPLKGLISIVNKTIQHYIPEASLYFLISLFFIFFGLIYIVKILKSNLLDYIKEQFSSVLFSNPIKAWLSGTIFTIFVQSSSVTTSLAIPLAASNTLTLEQIYPYTVGANLGTGITAFLAAAYLNPIALMTAYASLIFDLFGLCIVFPLPFLSRIPILLAKGFAHESAKYKAFPFIYLSLLFIFLPMIIIFFA